MHLPALKIIFKYFKGIKNVIEFGMGYFSTEFFIPNNCEVISIEMQDEKWFNIMKEDIGNYIKWVPIFNYGADNFDELIKNKKDLDLAFIDGHADSRPECVNLCFNKNIPIIIAHDFECPVYGWDRIKVPESYSKFIFNNNNSQTVLFIKN